jgi:ligand-binding sensor domain-containing protein
VQDKAIQPQRKKCNENPIFTSMSMRFLYALLLILSCENARSQEKDFIFKNYTMEDGLPSNEAYTVFRDSKNYIWMATDKGVVRFDGKEMAHFDLPDNVIFKIFEDVKGKIWFFSSSGQLAYYFENKIYPYKYNDKLKKEVVDPLINSAYVDEQENVYINGNNRYNYVINCKGDVEKFSYGSPILDTIQYEFNEHTPSKWICKVKRYGFNTKRIVFNFENTKSITCNVNLEVIGHYGVEQLDEHTLIFFSGNYLFKIDLNKSVKSIRLSEKILCIHIANKNKVHVGLSNQGMLDFDSNLNKVLGYNLENNKSVTGIVDDYEEGLWISTLESGVYHLVNTDIYQLHTGNDYRQPVFRICENAGDELLFANKKGIYQHQNEKASPIILKPISNVFDFNKARNLYNLSVSGIGYDKLFRFFNADNHSFRECGARTSMIELNNHNFLASDGVFLTEWITETNFRLPAFMAAIKTSYIFQDAQKNVWIGASNGLFQYDQQNSKPVFFPHHISFFSDGVKSMNQMDNGIYAIGLRNKGLALMKDTNLLGVISKNEGLASNSINFILPIKNQLWVVSEKGVSAIHFTSFSPLQYTITNIGQTEGLSNMVINQLVPYKGNILAATSNGIYVIENPDQFINQPSIEIPFYISNIQYYKGDTSNVTSLSIPFAKNRLTVQFGAISFNAANDIVYQYRFSNSDSTWNATKSNELLLENLSPGSYNLELKASIPDKHRTSVIKTLQIIIEKPWWQNNWIILFALLFLGLAIYVFYRFRIAKIKARANEKIDLNKKMLDLEQVALRSQMNPHFIFNCLTSIQQLIVSGNTIEANEYLVKFARLMRKTLENANNSFISLENEKEFLEEYVELEQLRIPGQFDFQIEIDETLNASTIEIPNMIIQPLVENSIRHGIMPLTDRKGQIEIHFSKQADWLRCAVKDNGIGYNPNTLSTSQFFTKHKSFGKDIVQKRLQILNEGVENNNLFNIEILKNEDGINAGTIITILLPIKTPQND